MGLRTLDLTVLVSIVAISGAWSAACSSGGEAGESVASSESALKDPARAACNLSKQLQRRALGRTDDGEDDSNSDDTSLDDGRHVFTDRKLHGLHGNGRACADCHMLSDNFQLSPASAQARYDALQACRVVSPDADDPLFRPVDADDGASDFSNLTQNGLVPIQFTLPANIRLVDPANCMTAGNPAPCQIATTYAVSSETTVKVWRSTPSVLNVAITGPDAHAPLWPRGPNNGGGYQLDARVDTLENQALGAFFGHAQVQVSPSASTLSDVATYETSLVSTTGRAPSTDLEIQGAAVFQRACSTCHNGPGLSTPGAGIVHFHDIASTCPRPADPSGLNRWQYASCEPRIQRNARTYEITFPDGAKQRRTTTDPGRALITGFVFFAPPPPPGGTCPHAPCGPPIVDDWQKLDVAGLHGVKNTAPYFHNNSAATLEDVVKHYEQFFKRVAALNPPPAPVPVILTTDGVHLDRPNVPAERDALVAFLNTL